MPSKWIAGNSVGTEVRFIVKEFVGFQYPTGPPDYRGGLNLLTRLMLQVIYNLSSTTGVSTFTPQRKCNRSGFNSSRPGPY